MMKIAKFDDLSVADAQQLHKVKRITESDPARHFVVVSASGREHKKDNKVTGLLYLIEAHLKYSADHLFLSHLIGGRLISIKNDLGPSYPTEEDLAKLKGQLNKTMSTDYLVSRGKYLTAKPMAEYFGFPFVDTEDITTSRYDGKIDLDAVKHRMDSTMKKLGRFAISDLYSVLSDGIVCTMSRGGSDITGSIPVDILNADICGNWIDASDVLTADLRTVHHPKRINTITYSELHELPYVGASVLHGKAIFPTKEKNIPINTLNINHPEEGGTITAEKDDHPNEQMITNIAGKKDFTVIAVYKSHMSGEVGIIHCVLKICKNYRISIEHIPSGIDSFGIVVGFEDVKGIIYDMADDMKRACNVDEIKIVDNISLIATVGRRMIYRPGVSGKLLAVLGKNNISIHMIAQETDKMNIIVGVENKDYEKTVETIYNNFVVQTHRMLHSSRIQNIQVEYEERVR